MSVGHCWHLADEIGRLPLSQWAERVKAIPEGCTHADCGEPKCCRTKLQEYLRVQFQCARSRAKRREEAEMIACELHAEGGK